MSADAASTDTGVGREAPRPELLVGVDGSVPSRHALAWAMRLAPQLGARVTALQVSDDVFTAHAKGYCSREQAEGWARQAREDGTRVMREMLDDIGVPDGLDVTLEVVPGQPSAVLLERSHDARMLVLGPRGMGRLRLLLGSVSLACLQQAACPVVIVRDEDHVPTA
jgi:nucleotide-binding universal stress UspA family protein